VSEQLSDRQSKLEIQAAGLSDVGQARKINQDRCLLLPEQGLYIVADGMGGHQAGEVAAEAVIEFLPRLLAEHLIPRRKEEIAPGSTLRAYDRASDLSNGQVETAIRESILKLSQQLYQAGLEDGSLRNMGSTLVLAYVRGRRLHLASMGDSRIYRLRSGNLEQLNEDHSVVALLIKVGQIKPEEAANHPARGAISRYVGMADLVDPDVWTDSLRPGDILLLCSDGLSGMVADEKIREMLLAYQDLEETCRALVEAANQAGGHDNITAVILRYG